MILQALNDYYWRKLGDPDPAKRLPAFGLEEKEIPFILEITRDGRLVQLRDTRSQDGKKKVGQRFLVPQAVKRVRNVAANLLWDTVEYVLGVDTRGKPERVLEQHAAFLARLEQLPEATRLDDGIVAVQAFFATFQAEQLELEPGWAEAKEANANLSFCLHGDLELICQRPAVMEAAMRASVQGADAATFPCLVTGKITEPERLHASIKGVWGAQSFGANIVSFNARAYESYGKTERQGENAPVSKAAAFAYTTALNHLLGKGSANRFQVGDTSTVCWAADGGEFDTVFADLFGEHDDPDQGTQAVKVLFEAVHSGRFASQEGDSPYYVLGLAPNAARISVRFFHRLRLSELAPRILQHFDDLELVRGPFDLQYPSLFRLLTACALQRKADNIPPNLGGAIVSAILAGPDAPYPSLWLNVAVNRCRAEQEVTYLRAAAIKACLNRHIRRHPNEEEFHTMLDLANTNPAYRLGRLFAALEKIQEEASPGLNATIRDRYYGAASSIPVTVFTTLLRLKNAHLKKLATGRANGFEKLLGEILGEVKDFPAHLALPDQGRFALGYYHQRQAFFTKAPAAESTESLIPA
jgi:CRISPR-associated protein Csd1